MSQHDYVIDNASGAAVRSDLNLAFGAIATRNSGGTAPTTTYAYMEWADTSNGALKQRNSANTAWIVRGRLEAEGVVAKGSNYTVDLADYGKTVVAASGTWTLSLTAAATLADGFWFAFRNAGSGIVTIDPDASELVDGATTLAIPAGFSVVVAGNGTAFRTTGLPPTMVGDSGSGGTRGLVPAPGAGDAAAGKFLKADGAWVKTAASVGLYQNRQTSGTAGPSFSSGSWRTVPLTTEVTDGDGIGSLASNQITLAAGTYEVWFNLVIEASNNTIVSTRLRNVTDAATLFSGLNSGYGGSGAGGQMLSVGGAGVFTLAGSVAIEFQIYPSGTQNGANASSNGEIEVYANVYLRKI